jgi:hypothetical protein
MGKNLPFIVAEIPKEGQCLGQRKAKPEAAAGGLA